MAISNLESRQFEKWRQIVKECGGDFVGVQSPLVFDPIGEHHIMFTSAGSTTLLSIPVSEFTQQAVMEKLGKKVTSVHLVELSKVKEDFARIANRLRALADEIEEDLKNG